MTQKSGYARTLSLHTFSSSRERRWVRSSCENMISHSFYGTIFRYHCYIFNIPSGFPFVVMPSFSMFVVQGPVPPCLWGGNPCNRQYIHSMHVVLAVPPWGQAPLAAPQVSLKVATSARERTRELGVRANGRIFGTDFETPKGKGQ